MAAPRRHPQFSKLGSGRRRPPLTQSHAHKRSVLLMSSYSWMDQAVNPRLITWCYNSLTFRPSVRWTRVAGRESGLLAQCGRLGYWSAGHLRGHHRTGPAPTLVEAELLGQSGEPWGTTDVYPERSLMGPEPTGRLRARRHLGNAPALVVAQLRTRRAELHAGHGAG